MAVFYTSDQHWHHKKVLDFENRPWDTVEEMNEGLIEAWNNVVGPDDTVHHLGDFSFGKLDEWRELLDRLNGKKILYKGNHDSSKILKTIGKEGYFKDIHVVGDYMKVHGYQMWVLHYPVEIGNRPNKFSIHGHIHSEEGNYLNQINVGVDSLMFKDQTKFGEPITEELLVDKMEELNEELRGVFEKERRKRR